MFHFCRSRVGSTEIFRVLIPQDSLPDAEARFGEPLRFDYREQRFHDVGIVVLIHDSEQTEYVVACKGQFRENELSSFYQQLEMLVGHCVHEGDEEPTNGWFMHGALKS